ncbi:MAG: hypothetical protein KDK91_32345 [Gammaproteobacteria bacterium]|nr:hypothetical protein [Gammaproteobacteria bacterium]
MKRSGMRVVARITAAWLAMLVAGGAWGATVSARYVGQVADDMGLGLIGESVTVRFRYDASVPSSGRGLSTAGPFAGNYRIFRNFLRSAQVQIGNRSWVWTRGGGQDWLSLHDQPSGDLLLFSANGFDGPALDGAGPVAAGEFGLRVRLEDFTPLPEPDGLSTELALPDIAPDPAVFEGGERSMIFYQGLSTDPGYLAVSADLTSSIALPLPPGLVLFGSALLLLGRPRSWSGSRQWCRAGAVSPGAPGSRTLRRAGRRPVGCDDWCAARDARSATAAPGC